jgi:hypothetical protein
MAPPTSRYDKKVKGTGAFEGGMTFSVLAPFASRKIAVVHA